MIRTKSGVLGFVCLFVLAAGQVAAADVELVEKLFVRGAANAAKGTSLGSLQFDDEVPDEILAFSWGVSNSIARPTDGGGAGVGKATFSDFSFVKKISKSSALLFDGCVKGKHFNQVKLTVRDDKGKEYMTVTLKDVYITSYQTGGSSGEDVLLDSTSINAGTIEYILIGL